MEPSIICTQTLHLIFISFIREYNALSLFLEVLQKTPVAHIRHDDVRGGASIETDSNETHHMSMFESTHLQTLLHKLVNLILIKITCRSNG